MTSVPSDVAPVLPIVTDKSEFQSIAGCPHAPLIAALIVFRVLYPVLPLAIGGGLVIYFERDRLAAKPQRRKTDGDP